MLSSHGFNYLFKIFFKLLDPKNKSIDYFNIFEFGRRDPNIKYKIISVQYIYLNINLKYCIPNFHIWNIIIIKKIQVKSTNQIFGKLSILIKWFQNVDNYQIFA